MSTPDRRTFLTASALGVGGLAFLDALPAVSAADAKLARLDPDIEPLVRVLEDTPRDKVLEEVAARIKRGLAYREVLAALLLAGVRNVQPRPSVGFKFHAVLVVNSAHLASLAGPDRERWLPLFWAIDYFKSAQAENTRESGWRMGPVDEAKVPPGHRAGAAFAAAMDGWDVEAADVAVAGLARTGSANELFELFTHYGCRDFRDIGHKAIFVANAFRTLQCIGWRYAEPVLRSLAYALLHHEGDNPAKRDGDPDRPGRRNAELAGKINPGWRGGRADPAASGDVLAAVRSGSADGASDKVVALLNGGMAAAAVWDGLFAGAAEMLMRQPGIVGLHTLTTMNALHYGYQTSAADATRKVLVLQAAAFLPLFREAMVARGKVSDARIDALEPAEGGGDIGEVFSVLSRDKASAARLALGALKADPANGRKLIDAGRLLVFLKGTDSHDYKFSAAVMEDYAAIGPAWRDRFLAASLYWLKGSAGPDAPVVGRTRAALA
ncbi:MAG TPA: hypothetical protein VH092_26735 [Urbifossiella sp.]|jgi:hypothetical protein|nr:hypothetical protein [Urbifossiella sp.]